MNIIKQIASLAFLLALALPTAAFAEFPAKMTEMEKKFAESLPKDPAKLAYPEFAYWCCIGNGPGGGIWLVSDIGAAYLNDYYNNHDYHGGGLVTGGACTAAQACFNGFNP